MKRNQIEDIVSKKNNQKITCLTSYTAPIAKIVDKYADIILVGDTLGMVIYGLESTCGVTIRMMIDHGKAVVSASSKALVVVDMPYGSYEKSKQQAYENASQIIKETGCDAVKLECTANMVDTVEYLVKKGIAVMGHIGLLPQHIHEIGGYKCQGRDEKSAKEITNIALELEKAGAFAVIIECVVENLAKEITEKLTVPTIGIGASPACDGQVLVIDDMLGIEQKLSPKFVKKYADLTTEIDKAVKLYCQEVKNGKFPDKRHVF